MRGRLLGIARKARPRGPMLCMAAGEIGLATGLAGDCRGVRRPRAAGRRQVTALLAADWRAALEALGGAEIDWSLRRANLLIEGSLPRAPGALVRIGAALLEITGECDPCRRMEAVAPGLEAALRPGWRGGRTLRVVEPGAIALGDEVRLIHADYREAI
ncbi:MOSC domain-containing protein [Sphingomonas morindae]|uniref:MOSC domain-containing protein n=1 Tax=Sphingomonas morindae TaxID=1541170 RepID=A0ABY4XA07_9SPHN|nr:MOSC domain-containing protein [Sphingomonas morindae]USI73695.1 MOSC domain-containing protein [Sphingomonas morindae]